MAESFSSLERGPRWTTSSARSSRALHGRSSKDEAAASHEDTTDLMLSKRGSEKSSEWLRSLGSNGSLCRPVVDLRRASSARVMFLQAHVQMLVRANEGHSRSNLPDISIAAFIVHLQSLSIASFDDMWHLARLL